MSNLVMQEEMDVIALQETIKSDFCDNDLKEMSGNKIFQWFWIPARGHSGGLATGINSDLLEIELSRSLQHSIWVLVRNRLTNFRYWVVNVYGPADHDFFAEFVLELTEICNSEQLLVLMGDFNLIRTNGDRNKGQGDPRLMDLFNNFIGTFQLREIFIVALILLGPISKGTLL